MEIVPPNHAVPNSINLLIGTTSGTVSDIQAPYNIDVLDISEAAETPGIDLRIFFTNILRFDKLFFGAHYNGRATHYVEVQVFNFVTNQWEVYAAVSFGYGMDFQYLEICDSAEHIKDAEVWVRFVHPLLGVVPDNLYVDYVALVR